MNKQNVLGACQVAFTYLGALVGAGFASGQELLRFFAVFGRQGILGAVFAGFLFGFFGLCVIKLVVREKMESYGQLLHYLFGKRAAFWAEGLLDVFLLSCLAVMLVAGGSLFYQLWDFPFWFGFFLTAVVVYLVLFVGIEGVLWLNTALIPGLVILSLAIAYLNWPRHEFFITTSAPLNLVGGNWLVATWLYVSYNFILGSVILASLGERAERGGMIGSLLGGIALGLLAAIISWTLWQQPPALVKQTLPMLALAYQVHPLLSWVYSFALWVAILTTAFSIGFGLLKRLEQLLVLPRLGAILLIFIPTFPFIAWSFPQMVSTVYPLIGYCGFVYLLVILCKTLARESKKR